MTSGLSEAPPAGRTDPLVGRAMVAVIGLSVVASGLAIGLIAGDLTPGRPQVIKVMALVGAAGFGAASVLAGRRRSTRGLQTLMLAASCAWLLSALRFVTDERLLFTLGILGAWLWAAVLGHIALAFPSGRLPGRPERIVIGLAYFAAIAVQLAWVVVAGPATFALEECEKCPMPMLSLGEQPELATSVIALERLLAGTAAVGVGVLLARRWRRGNAVQRRSLAPVLAVGTFTAVCFSASVVALAAGWSGVGRAFQVPAEAGFVLVPFAFLGGIWRTRIRTTFGVSRFVEQLDRLPGLDHMATRLASALGDDSLTVAYWLPTSERYVDHDGRPLTLPPDGVDRAVTHVSLDGRPVAAVVHDASLAEEAVAVRAAGRAAVLWFERDRLEAERRAYIAELRASRGRLVAAGDTQRRRIERDLHDGAQQRLAAMLLRVKLERRGCRGDTSRQAALLDEVEAGITAALDELRALAAGILPPVLGDQGVAAAIEELASRSPVPVSLSLDESRLPEPVEVAAYFVAAEALANVAKHANADRAFISTSRVDSVLILEVRDNGDGGADLDNGSGLRGLSDRLGALDGSISVVSPAGAGTTLRAEIPCAS